MKIKKFAIYVKKNFLQTKIIRKSLENCEKSETIAIIQENIEELLIVINHRIPKEIPVVFHNGSAYDYHYIIKQLAREFKGNFECVGENTEKYITFSVPIRKKHDNGKTYIYKLKFIDSCRLMPDSLSNLVDNLSEINNKEPKDKFIDSMRSMTDPLSQSINKISQIDRKISLIDIKESENKFIDNMRSTTTSLSQSIDKVSEIDKKTSQINRKESENKFIDNMRSMTALLSQSIDIILETEKKISQAVLTEKFPNIYKFCNGDLNKF